LFLTYTLDAGFSPTKTTAKVGVMDLFFKLTIRLDNLLKTALLSSVPDNILGF
jgi:hypothetical protein